MSSFLVVSLTGVTVILTMGLEIAGLDGFKHLLSPCPMSGLSLLS